MNEKTLLDMLRTVRFLEGASEQEQQKLASVAEFESYQPGVVVFREGERLSRIFMVVDGSVSLEVRMPGQGPRRIHTVGPGELLGWSPVLGPQPMTATARAVTPTKLVSLDAGQVLALCHHDPAFGFAFMHRVARALAQRLNATRLQLLDVYRYELPAAVET
jgi:CRP-like cAMP-binding protein